MKDIHSRIERIQRREDLASFVEDLAKSLESKALMWSNDDLVSYLEAMSGWIADMDGYFQNQGKPCPEKPSWKTIAEILIAASNYE